MIALLLDSERDSGEVTYMPEELDVADEIEIGDRHCRDRGGQQEDR